FDLDDKILLALIGGTTLNVLGIFTIVTNFLFPKSGASIFSQTAGALMHPLRPKASPKKKPKEKEPADSTAS
ncbi:hypothetical protein QR510_29170, partial [Escherichia coli]|uniref:hypothetical protein n=1 Tax=Escherichia coli TaxID=562 RepID=UPI0027386F20